MPTYFRTIYYTFLNGNHLFFYACVKNKRYVGKKLKRYECPTHKLIDEKLKKTFKNIFLNLKLKISGYNAPVQIKQAYTTSFY